MSLLSLCPWHVRDDSFLKNEGVKPQRVRSSPALDPDKSQQMERRARPGGVHTAADVALYPIFKDLQKKRAHHFL